MLIRHLKFIVLALAMLNLAACGGGGDDSESETQIIESGGDGSNDESSAGDTCESTEEETSEEEQTSCSGTASSTIEFNGLQSISDVTNASLQLNWSNHSDAKGYVVFETSSGAQVFKKFVEAPSSGTVVTGLTPNTSYRFLVKSVDEYFLQDTNTNEISETTLNAPPDQLLDTIAGRSSVFSLRKLTSSYSGDAIAVRRSSDDAIAEIGFSGFDLDTTALNNHLDGSTGYVVRWYDQSGSGFDVEQTDPNHQPQIVVASTDNARPAIRFDGVDDHLYNSSVSYDAHSAFVYFKMSSISQQTSDLAQLWGSYGDSVHIAPDPRSPTTTSFDGTSGGSTQGIFALDGASYSTTYASNPASTGWSYDTDHVFAAEYENAITLNSHTLGSLYPSFGIGDHQYGGDISEIIVFSEPKSASDKSTIESNMMDYY